MAGMIALNNKDMLGTTVPWFNPNKVRNLLGSPFEPSFPPEPWAVGGDRGSCAEAPGGGDGVHGPVSRKQFQGKPCRGGRATKNRLVSRETRRFPCL